MDAATLTYDTLGFGEFDDFPETSEPVWILGKEFNALTEKEDILSHVTSRLWFTYRKNFPPIGGTGPTSDTGWGCMLRCGQMILGEALVRRHLGRDWRWVRSQSQREDYIGILNAFLDKKDGYYSLHQIAQMGVGEGKSIGQWYGPNTVAQVLKKLAVFDSWSRLAVHVAMDNTVVIEEIKRLCMPWLDYGGAACVDLQGGMSERNGCLEGACALAEEETALWNPLLLLIPLRLGLSDINEAYIETLKQCFQLPQSLGVIGGKPNSAHYFIGYVERLCMPWLDYGGAACAEPPGWIPKHNGCLEGACALAEEETALWKPLVLLIPLRLGLSDINKAYIETLKQCFQLPQSLGVIGGKPNSAHYFIGYVGEELIYLDPHTTQPAVEPCEDSQVPDDTYHCQHPPCRMHICEIDPSVAVGFFCRTEDDFDDWCMRIRKLPHTRGSLPMFELVDCQPSHLACSVDVLNLTPDEAGIQSEVRCGQAPFKGNFPDVRGDRVHDFSDRLERFFDSEDEEFEILSL